jgi:hypothetical protein
MRQNWLQEFENNWRRNTIRLLTLRIRRKMLKEKNNKINHASGSFHPRLAGLASGTSTPGWLASGPPPLPPPPPPPPRERGWD